MPDFRHQGIKAFYFYNMQNLPLIKQRPPLEQSIFSKMLTLDHIILTCIIINATSNWLSPTFGRQHKYEETNILFMSFRKITICITYKKAYISEKN